MRCANPSCRISADELFKGTLRLVEFETAPDDRVLYSTGGFPVFTARTRYFWLCRACSQMFTIAKWNPSGLVLEPLPGNGRQSPPKTGAPEITPKVLERREGPGRTA